MSKKRKADAATDQPASEAKKAKGEEAEAPAKGGDVSVTTVMASGLPATMTSERLSELFSAVGPIRSAFVAQDKEAVSKGYGFVRFVMPEDARQALADLNNSNQDGTRIKVTWARRRHREAEKALDEGEAKAAPPKAKEKEKPKWVEAKEQQRVRAAAHESLPDATRTVLVRGLARAETPAADEETKKALYKKAKKLIAKHIGQGEISVQWPLEFEGAPAAHILVPNGRTAHLLANQLNNHIFKSQLLLCCQLNERDAVTRKGRARGGARLIVRNLAWDVTPADLSAVFAAYGPLHSVDIPRKPDAPERARGFAFVWMLRKPDAEKAIAGVNGTEIAAGYAAARVQEGADNRKKSEKRKDAEKPAKVKGRVVAVDWALSKDQWEATNADGAPTTKTEDAEVKADEDEDMVDIYGQAPGEQSDGYLSEELSDSDESMFGEHEPSDDEMDEDVKPDDEELDLSGADGQTDRKGKAKASTEGLTLFIRNIQFEATEDELYALMKSYGPVQYARIAMDPKTGRSRGTGFVHFYRAEDAHNVIKESEKLFAQSSAVQATSNPFAQPSILQADPSSSSARGLSLHGRVLSVSKAVSKDEAESLRDARDKANEKKDRRNLYLLREGAIVPNSPQANALHRSDLEARQTSFDARKALIRTNPSLYISRTRLSVRQLPLFVNDRLLRKLALFALKAYDNDVKAGKLPALTADELSNEPGDVLGVEAPKPAQKGKPPPSRVRQAKVNRQTDRVDPLTGEGRSKGYGFLELGSHADALRVLRWANANRSVGSILRGWWKDELTSQLASAEKEPEGADKEARKERLLVKVAELDAESQRAEAKAAAKGTSVAGLEARANRTLIMELSIENAVTVKRRQERTERSRAGAEKRKQQAATDGDDGGQPDEEAEEKPQSGKKRKGPPGGDRDRKRRKDDVKPKAESSVEPKSQMGGLIGRKRKEKKQKRAGKS